MFEGWSGRWKMFEGSRPRRKGFVLRPKGKAEPARPRAQPRFSSLRNAPTTTSLFQDHHIKTSSHASVNLFCLQSTNSLHYRRLHFIGDVRTPFCELAGFVINTARPEQSQYHYRSDSSVPSDSAIVLEALGFPAYQRYLFSSGQNVKRRSLSAQALTTSKHLYESNSALDDGKRLIASIGAGPNTYLR